jgi:hypothetical protein
LPKGGVTRLIEVRIFIKTARERQQNVIRHKIGLLNLAAELGNVSKTCKGRADLFRKTVFAKSKTQ